MKLTIDLEKLKQDLISLLGCSGRTLQRWRKMGFPQHGLGPGCYYVWSEVMPWVIAFRVHMEGSAAPAPQCDSTAPQQRANWFKALELLDSLKTALEGGAQVAKKRPEWVRRTNRQLKVGSPRSKRKPSPSGSKARASNAME